MEATYTAAYIAHAPLEPGAAVAWWSDGKSGTLTVLTGTQRPYEIPSQRIAFHSSQSPLRQGSYRGLAATANHFAREAHMDDLAHAVKIDPLEFRLKNLKEPRMRAVLNAAADSFGWGKSKQMDHQGSGISCGW